MKRLVMSRLLLLITSFFIFAQLVNAQLSAGDSVFYQKAINNTIVFFQQSIGEQSRLFNGRQFLGYPFTFKEGHPFFYTDVLSGGSIVYDNVYYPDVQMLYDEVADVLIIQNGIQRIQLSSERISRFRLSDRDFIRIVKDSLDSPILSSEGFYNVLYKGNVSVFKQEVKSIFTEITSDEGILRYIKVKQYFYIKKDGKYYLVNRKNDLLDIYKEKKKEIRDYIKSNGLSFSDDKESLIVKVSAYYDQPSK
ncbi:hypothetical protein [Flavihumibacter profundi]|uniref:hypothetical protein n=1 Tax=Flavihumibacter profundi TaxID=2716883 RepID=UPI001CC33584|nr:hypothetical protein [Flavihumibacter profundi]MBZ5859354.1 hypothetical protein [Flavihumibacter profundi]